MLNDTALLSAPANYPPHIPRLREQDDFLDVIKFRLSEIPYSLGLWSLYFRTLSKLEYEMTSSFTQDL